MFRWITQGPSCLMRTSGTCTRFFLLIDLRSEEEYEIGAQIESERSMSCRKHRISH
jgi:hypothetical protein